MQLIRSFIFTLGMWLYTPPFVIVALIICIPLSPHHRYQVISTWARTMLWWLRVTCNLSYKVTGAENIPDTPCIIMPKHQSMWDTLVVQAIFPTQVWVFKRELLFIPFFGWGLSMTSPIAIDRHAGRKALAQLTTQGQDRLSRGFYVVIFPEGTRTAPGERGKYHIGGAWLATHTNTPVLPVALNAGRFWSKRALIKKTGIIDVVICKPISPTGLKADALTQLIETSIEAEMLHL